jgi:hypothetical protein
VYLDKPLGLYDRVDEIDGLEEEYFASRMLPSLKKKRVIDILLNQRDVIQKIENIIPQNYPAITQRYKFIASLVFYVYSTMISIKTRIANMKEICSHRVEEGKFINASLNSLRDNITTIMSIKHENVLFYSPHYIQECRSSYCPADMLECFHKPMRNIPDPDGGHSRIESDLIRWIYNRVNSTTENIDIIKQFYKDLVVSIFCVFNVSPYANNPPNVLYIDIQKLKHAHYVKRDYAETVKELNKLYNFLMLGNHPGTLQKRGKLKPHEAMLLDTVDKTSILDKLTAIIKFIPKNTNFMFNDFNIMTEQLIQNIDTHNAVTPIGTVEWIDSLTKLNTVETVCFDYKRSLISLYGTKPNTTIEEPDTRGLVEDTKLDHPPLTTPAPSTASSSARTTPRGPPLPQSQSHTPVNGPPPVDHLRGARQYLETVLKGRDGARTIEKVLNEPEFAAPRAQTAAQRAKTAAQQAQTERNRSARLPFVPIRSILPASTKKGPETAAVTRKRPETAAIPSSTRKRPATARPGTSSTRKRSYT